MFLNFIHQLRFKLSALLTLTGLDVASSNIYSSITGASGQGPQGRPFPILVGLRV